MFKDVLSSSCKSDCCNTILAGKDGYCADFPSSEDGHGEGDEEFGEPDEIWADDLLPPGFDGPEGFEGGDGAPLEQLDENGEEKQVTNWWWL